MQKTVVEDLHNKNKKIGEVAISSNSKNRKAGGLASIFLAAAMAITPAVMPTYTSAQTVNTDIEAAQNTYLGYIITGNDELDTTSAAGLYGLGNELYKRTGLENLYVTDSGAGAAGNQLSSGQVMPRGIDPERDDLSVYPFIYWPMDPGQPELSQAAIDNLNQYMRNGGLLFIDTRDSATFGRGKTRLERAVDNGLRIPALETVEPCPEVREECHVLSRAFFLLSNFSGRYTGGQIWAERTNEYRHDGVATVIIGGNDWAAAWAKDAEGNYLFPVVGSDPQQRDYAYRVGINAVMYALTGNYKGDQLHIDTILDRMGQSPR